ncbi:hypothetical protein [Paramixta manurensis]
MKTIIKVASVFMVVSMLSGCIIAHDRGSHYHYNGYHHGYGYHHHRW